MRRPIRVSVRLFSLWKGLRQYTGIKQSGCMALYCTAIGPLTTAWSRRHLWQAENTMLDKCLFSFWKGLSSASLSQIPRHHRSSSSGDAPTYHCAPQVACSSKEQQHCRMAVLSLEKVIVSMRISNTVPYSLMLVRRGSHLPLRAASSSG